MISIVFLENLYKLINLFIKLYNNKIKFYYVYIIMCSYSNCVNYFKILLFFLYNVPFMECVNL